MSYAYSPASSRAVALAAYAAATAAAVTGTPTPIPVPGATDGFLVALVDAVLGVVGFQAQDNQAASAFTFTGSYANVYPPYTFFSPVATTYLVQIDVDVNFAALTGGRGSAVFQLNAGAGPTTYALPRNLEWNDISCRPSGHWVIPVAMVAGNNVLQLQGKNSALGTCAVDTVSRRIFTVTG